MRVAVIDIGSNSFRLLVSLVRPDGGISTLHRERHMLHLGATVARHGHIPDQDIERSVAAIRSMGDFLDRFGVDRILCVATAALREATNGPEVADRLGQLLGTSVRVISGEQEARLSYLGVASAVEFHSEQRAVLDLGGGSLELAAGVGSTADVAVSWPVGVSRLHALIGSPGPMTVDHARRVRALVRDQLTGTGPLATGTQAVLIGGTVRALARHVADPTRPWVPRSLNQLTVTRDQLATATAEILPLTPVERVDLHSLDPERAPFLPIAGLVITEAMDALGIEEATISDWGLRTGVILDALGIEPPSGPEVRERSIRALREEFLGDDPHPAHVADLAAQLISQVGGAHNITANEAGLIDAAAHLHDIGRALSLSGRHRHSAYLVEHADLRGLSPDDLGVVLSLVRSHRGGAPKISYPPFRAMDVGQRRRVRVMSAFLQLADGLDLPRDGGVHTIVAADDGDVLLIRAFGEIASLEADALGSRISHAETSLGRRVELRTG